MPTRRKSTAKRKASASGKAKKTTRKKSARPAAGQGLEALARKIVGATLNPSKFKMHEFYTPDCESMEANGQVDHGYDGLEKKLERWEQMQKGVRWTARHVLTGKNVVCIEWDAEVTLNDGRTAKLVEVAVHEIKGGKIVRERYYYNPMALMPPQN
ncbi:MAG TPA: nuclear transport factor 2 family protein [Myxococcota bacterium]|nr:nuclear transport factor 2 family protein [Myxococcota bacterium]